MSESIEWKEPPPRKGGSRIGDYGRIARLIEALKERPGAWAVAGRFPSAWSGNSSSVYARKKGLEATLRKEGDQRVLYVRWPESNGNGSAE